MERLHSHPPRSRPGRRAGSSLPYPDRRTPAGPAQRGGPRDRRNTCSLAPGCTSPAIGPRMLESPMLRARQRGPVQVLSSKSHIEVGTPAFRRVTLALTAAGFSTFTVLYCVQPLMPVFADEFRVSPAECSLTLSLSTGVLAITLLIAGPLSEVWGRKPIMVASLV